MSVEIRIGHTRKRKNSISHNLPTYKTFQCLIKEDTSIYSPTITISTTEQLINGAYNYSYMPLNSNYYWIEDVRSVSNNLYELDLKIDVLASYKSQILSNTCYVKYSSNYWKKFLPDSRLSQNSNVTTKITYAPVEWGGSGGVLNEELLGYYCISLIARGNHLYLYLKEDQLEKLKSFFTNLDNLGDIEEMVGKTLGDTSQCITSCRYIHHINNKGSALPVILPNGTEIYGINIYSSYRTDSGTTTISIPWQYELSDFRNRSEYTKLLLKLPFYGVVEIPVEQVFGKSSITVDYSCDCVTGDWVYTIAELGDQKFSVNVSFEVQLSTSSSPSLINNTGAILGGLGHAVIGGAEIASGNVLGGAMNAIGGVAKLGNGIMSSYAITPSSVGGNTSVAGIDADFSSFRLTSFTHAPFTNLETHAKYNGRPYNDYTKLSNISGYCECVVSSVDNVQAPQWIQEEICQYLNSGVYIE